METLTSSNKTSGANSSTRPVYVSGTYPYSLLNTSNSLHRLWFSRGRVLAKQEYYDAALASFNVALQLAPGHHRSWVFRGVVLTHLKQYQAALDSFDQALKLAPQDQEAWIFRGAVLSYLNCHQEALSSYSTALKIKPSHRCRDYPLWIPATIKATSAEHYYSSFQTSAPQPAPLNEG